MRPARQLSHGVESQHLVAGSDQSTPLETHQHPRTHAHTPLPPVSRGTVGSERERETESKEGKQREKWIGLLNGCCAASEVSCSKVIWGGKDEENKRRENDERHQENTSSQRVEQIVSLL